ncbi:hypothetical protein TNCT_123551 [Trichonephila clavata]|uniref:Uncharacterized protein n=1 Tax=Trichonephila clavata TaxID=2740835 RepID=A0A8X6KQD9_TRICU|nr:hypothetical protein TNCT_123551 [Trichonephila clavata]
MLRPLQRLYPLELTRNNKTEVGIEYSEFNTDSNEIVYVTRSDGEIKVRSMWHHGSNSMRSLSRSGGRVVPEILTADELLIYPGTVDSAPIDDLPRDQLPDCGNFPDP